MNGDVIPEILNLSVQGVPVALGVLVIVGALKVSGLVKNDQSAIVANIIVSIIMGGVWFALQFEPATMGYKEIIGLAYVALIGALISGLGYQVVKAAAGFAQNRSSDGGD